MTCEQKCVQVDVSLSTVSPALGHEHRVRSVSTGVGGQRADRGPHPTWGPVSSSPLVPRGTRAAASLTSGPSMSPPQPLGRVVW